MILTHINIHNLRNISEEKLSFHPQANLFLGANGAGKSSILEAIYLLVNGHSFRTRESSALIQKGMDSLTIFGRTHEAETISIQKKISGPTLIQYNQLPCSRTSDLAKRFPCQIIHQNIFQIIDAGPSARRMILDWGLFHVEPSYHLTWKNYHEALKHRNALLRSKAKQDDFKPWNMRLSEEAEKLHQFRAEYFLNWRQHFQDLLPLLTTLSCDIKYDKGWDKRNGGKVLEAILDENHFADSQRQYTQYGAHQADIRIETPLLSAKGGLSRGEQKIVLIALKLAQSKLLNRSCLYLLDDVIAELDAQHMRQLLDCLKQLKGQFFISSLEPGSMAQLSEALDSQLFIVQKGKISSTN